MKFTYVLAFTFPCRVRRERRGPWMKCRVRTINKLFYSRMISLFSDIWLMLNNFYMKPALSGIFSLSPFSLENLSFFSYYYYYFFLLFYNPGKGRENLNGQFNF